MLHDIFSASSFMPHGHCYLWKPGLVWLHVVSDAFITLAYYCIPFALVRLVRLRKDLAFDWMFVLFAIFIVACGTTHLMEIWSVWIPSYWASGAVKALTALASVPTAILLVRLLPKLLALPSPTQLVQANASLEKEIVQHKQTEAALRASEEKFRSLLDTNTEWVWETDRDHRLTYSNPAVEAILGTPPGEFEQSDRLAWVHEDDRAAAEQKRAENGAQKRGWNGEVLRWRHRNGSYRYLESRAIPILDDAGEVTGYRGTDHDVTERIFREEKEAAERANRAKSEFLSRMSHELRTPLNAILGFGQLLEMEAAAPNEQENAEQILKAGRHLLELVDEVLDISRIEAGRLALTRETLPLQAILQDCLGLMQPLLDEAKVHLNAKVLEPCHCFVRGDHHRLKQVLLNLLSNAVKYNTIGGSVTVSCEPAGDNCLRINVRDTGRGITEENIARLFTPFERLDAEQAGISGTGLGLALSRRLMGLMGGSLGVESTFGRGSVFWVQLPIAKGPAPAPFTEEAVASGADRKRSKALAPAGSPKVILYIEDNLSNLRLVERVIARRQDVKLIPAMQGSLGCDLAREHRPDLILLDLDLPDIDGAEVLNRLRADEQTRDIPVVVVSADAMPAKREALLSLGAVGYVTKPFNVTELLETLADAFGAEHGALR